jgi:tRNA dimethylallyltransferase
VLPEEPLADPGPRAGPRHLAAGTPPAAPRPVARSRRSFEICKTGPVNIAAASPRVVAVVGPTAAGKSDLGVVLARHLDGEVVNADSMQLYRGMDIGTAKLTAAERGGVPHRLLDIWDVTEAASVAEYQRLARAEMDRLLAAGRTPVLVGGSGLYVRGAIDALDFPGTDPVVRARLEAELAEQGCGALHARLAAADPEAGRAILPSNGRRVVRALEVIEITGRPFTANLPGHQAVYETLQIGVDVERPELDERITLRVDRMWEAGLVDEVRRLEAAGLRAGRTASRALGYQQVLAALAEESTEEHARAETVRATKRFARRQDSWFRRDPRVHWLSGAADRRDELVTRALALVERAVTA